MHSDDDDNKTFADRVSVADWAREVFCKRKQRTGMKSQFSPFSVVPIHETKPISWKIQWNSSISWVFNWENSKWRAFYCKQYSSHEWKNNMWEGNSHNDDENIWRFLWIGRLTATAVRQYKFAYSVIIKISLTRLKRNIVRAFYISRDKKRSTTHDNQVMSAYCWQCGYSAEMIVLKLKIKWKEQEKISLAPETAQHRPNIKCFETMRNDGASVASTITACLLSSVATSFKGKKIKLWNFNVDRIMACVSRRRINNNNNVLRGSVLRLPSEQ